MEIRPAVKTALVEFINGMNDAKAETGHEIVLSSSKENHNAIMHFTFTTEGKSDGKVGLKILNASSELKNSATNYLTCYLYIHSTSIEETTKLREKLNQHMR